MNNILDKIEEKLIEKLDEYLEEKNEELIKYPNNIFREIKEVLEAYMRLKRQLEEK